MLRVCFRCCRSTSVLKGSVAVIRKWCLFISYCKLTAVGARADLRRSRSNGCDSLQRATNAHMSARYTEASIGKCWFWPFYLWLRANLCISSTCTSRVWVRSCLIADYSPLVSSAISVHPQQPPLSAVYRPTAGQSANFDGRWLFCGLLIHHQQTFWHFFAIPCQSFLSVPARGQKKMSQPDLFALNITQWKCHWNVFFFLQICTFTWGIRDNVQFCSCKDDAE